MRIFFYSAFFILFILSIACKNKTSSGVETATPHRSKPINQNILKEIIIDTNLLASKKDLVCYMPLWTGIADTCLYQGKIYGFCSKSCKEDFLKDPESFLPH
jgi:YHS domain-containing protein